MLFEGCVEAVCRVCGSCLQGSGGCGEAVWRIWVVCLDDVERLSLGCGRLSGGVGQLS